MHGDITDYYCYNAHNFREEKRGTQLLQFLSVSAVDYTCTARGGYGQMLKIVTTDRVLEQVNTSCDIYPGRLVVVYIDALSFANLTRDVRACCLCSIAVCAARKTIVAVQQPHAKDTA